jgi:hypothetical protein
LPGLRDRALLLTCFAGGLRRSELVALDREDIRFTSEGLVLRIRQSKGDQEGEGEGAEVGIGWGSRPLTCPVRAMEIWLRRSGITYGAVFPRADRVRHQRGTAVSRGRRPCRLFAARCRGGDGPPFLGAGSGGEYLSGGARAGARGHPNPGAAAYLRAPEFRRTSPALGHYGVTALVLSIASCGPGIAHNERRLENVHADARKFWLMAKSSLFGCILLRLPDVAAPLARP